MALGIGPIGPIGLIGPIGSIGQDPERPTPNAQRLPRTPNAVPNTSIRSVTRMRGVKSIPTAALAAIVLWGSVALVQTIRAQESTQTDSRKSGQTLTYDSMQKMLDGMGYESKKMTTGVLVSIKKEGWTYPVHMILSDDKSKVGFSSVLGTVTDIKTVTASQWLGLLTANQDIDPSFFFVDKDTKTIYIHRVLDNRSITPAYLKVQTDNFCSNIKQTEKAWGFAK